MLLSASSNFGDVVERRHPRSLKARAPAGRFGAAEIVAGPRSGHLGDCVGARLAASGAAFDPCRTVPHGFLGRPLAGAAFPRARCRARAVCRGGRCRAVAADSPPLADPHRRPRPPRPRHRHPPSAGDRVERHRSHQGSGRAGAVAGEPGPQTRTPGWYRQGRSAFARFRRPQPRPRRRPRQTARRRHRPTRRALASTEPSLPRGQVSPSASRPPRRRGSGRARAIPACPCTSRELARPLPAGCRRRARPVLCVPG